MRWAVERYIRTSVRAEGTIIAIYFCATRRKLAEAHAAKAKKYMETWGAEKENPFDPENNYQPDNHYVYTVQRIQTWNEAELLKAIGKSWKRNDNSSS